ncbi:hypothetical protein [Pseudomonas putida]
MPRPFSRSAPALLLASSLLGGCSFHGTYPDATEPDAAKLRFIANTSNATLDIFDSEHCEGRTTGLLNNLFARDTQRRVGISVPPPADARGYLEIKLAPGHDQFMRLNTLGSYSVCTIAFNFTPVAGAEYEVMFDTGGGRCEGQLRRLRKVDGKDVRTPVPMLETGVQACAGTSPMFPSRAPQPDTPQRLALIDGILASGTKGMPANPPMVWPKTLDQLVDERKAKLGFVLPDAYWAQYRQNMQAYQAFADTRGARALQQTTDEFRVRLRASDDDMLQRSANDPAGVARAVRMYYTQAAKRAALDTVTLLTSSMGKLDAQYDVCARYSDCWKADLFQ